MTVKTYVKVMNISPFRVQDILNNLHEHTYIVWYTYIYMHVQSILHLHYSKEVFDFFTMC